MYFPTNGFWGKSVKVENKNVCTHTRLPNVLGKNRDRTFRYVSFEKLKLKKIRFSHGGEGVLFGRDNGCVEF